MATLVLLAENYLTKLSILFFFFHNTGLVFGVRGSRDASREEAHQQVRTVAGVKIPGRPEEPTNCCMSGCVNCVWEMYKDDLTDYKQKKREAYKALMQRPEVKWPEDLFGPEPLSRLSESDAKARKEIKSTDTTDPAKSNDSSLSSTNTSELDVGFSRIEDDDDLDVSIKQFLMLENRIKEKKRENKLNQTAASRLSTSNSDPQAHV